MPNSLGQPSAPRSDSQIRDMVSRLEERAQQLHGGLNAIEERLDTVLRPVPPELVSKAANNIGVETRSPEAHLTSRLREVSAALELLEWRFQNLHGRIEV